MVETEAVRRKKEYILRKKAEKDATKEERRARAISEGKPYEFIVCPLCLRARIAKSWKGKLRFKIDPNPEVIQVRYGMGGQGKGGFYKNAEECIRLDELEEANPEVYANIKTEVGKLYNIIYKVEMK